jgi:hypothetical protein
MVCKMREYREHSSTSLEESAIRIARGSAAGRTVDQDGAHDQPCEALIVRDPGA